LLFSKYLIAIQPERAAADGGYDPSLLGALVPASPGSTSPHQLHAQGSTKPQGHHWTVEEEEEEEEEEQH